MRIMIDTTLVCLCLLIFSNCLKDNDNIIKGSRPKSITSDTSWRANLVLSSSDIIDVYLKSLPQVDFYKEDVVQYDNLLFEDTLYNFLSKEKEFLLYGNTKNDIPIEFINLLDRKIIHPKTGEFIVEGVDSYAKSGLASCNNKGPVIVFSSKKSVYSSLLVFLFLREHEFAHHILGHINCPNDLRASESEEFQADSLAVLNIQKIVGNEYSRDILISTVSTFISKEKESRRLRSPSLSARACKISELAGNPYWCWESNMLAIREMLSFKEGEILATKINPEIFDFTYLQSDLHSKVTVVVNDSIYGISALDSILKYTELKSKLAPYKILDTLNFPGN